MMVVVVVMMRLRSLDFVSPKVPLNDDDEIKS